MTRPLIYSKIRHFFPAFSRLFHVLDILNPLRLVKRRMGSVGQMLLSWFSVARPGVLDTPQSRLLTLPLEVLTGIVQELSWREELLRDSTMGGNELFFERPVEQYRPGELERSILRWKRAKRNWTADDGTPPQMRSFDAKQVEHVHLVRGGRWLLFATSSSSVVYADLDAPGPPILHTLIPARPFLCRITMALEYLPEAEVLSFNLVLAVQQFECKQTPVDAVFPEFILQVWKIRLDLRDNNQDSVDRLMAECLTSFRQEPQGFVNSVSILGDYIAHTVCFSGDYEDLNFIVVTKWADRVKEEVDYPKWVHYLNVNWQSVYLLPGHHLLVYVNGSIELYDFFLFPNIKSLPDQPDRTTWAEPIWRTFIDGADTLSAPPVIFGPDSVRMVVFCKTGFRGLTVHTAKVRAERESPVSTSDLGDYAPDSLHTLPSYGYRHSALLSRSRLTLVSHPWPDEGGKGHMFVDKITSHDGQGDYRLLDIMSGRIVIVDREIIVLDLAPSFFSTLP
ncbi:hypothetical protein BDN72DRAFT_881790 [Pluteus cervinus]|uniref:Uncharacterized protein n=1 Tax=Pluteus cervinus TaxID=181527 RepID=A0ACD3ADL8_9AGAR|nr:hypothetical protein BDN72DRAFT_881790 [Pluteus cervinus]